MEVELHKPLSPARKNSDQGTLGRTVLTAASVRGLSAPGCPLILAHRVALDPTCKQRRYFTNAAGCARFTWNWGVAEWEQQFKAGGKPTAAGLRKRFNAVKYEQWPWMAEISKHAHAQPFANLGAAYKRFFDGLAHKPTFKKKGKCRDSFYVANDRLTVDGFRVRLPVVGWVRMREELRFAGRIMSAVVSRTADRWFVSFCVDLGDFHKPRTADGTVGADLGLTNAAVLSTGEVIEGPKALKNNLKKLKRLNKSLSRKQKGSNRREIAKRKLARLHAKIANIRKDATHKLTTRLCRENQAVGTETLNVVGMLKNRKLAQAVSDAAFGDFGRQMRYKAPIYRTALHEAPMFYPSSKKCSACGKVKEKLLLSERIFRCEGCGAVIDRDHNASLNLEQLCTAGLAGTHARGQMAPSAAG